MRGERIGAQEEWPNRRSGAQKVWCTGLEEDTADYHARYYEVRLGRWLSADTVVPEAGDPQSLNRFSYVLGNPVLYADPSGRSSANPPPGTPPHSACSRYPGLQGCQWFTHLEWELGVRESRLPLSYVRVGLSAEAEWHGETAGVIVATNAILTHGHHIKRGESPDDLASVTLRNRHGVRMRPDIPARDFTFVELDDVSLIVFRSEMFSLDQVALLGNAAELEPGRIAYQAIYQGTPSRRRSQTGLYSTRVVETRLMYTDNRRGIQYECLRVRPDLTIGGDSGAPLYVNGHVYAINHGGRGVFTSVTNPSHILNLISILSVGLRGWE